MHTPTVNGSWVVLHDRLLRRQCVTLTQHDPNAQFTPAREWLRKREFTLKLNIKTTVAPNLTVDFLTFPKFYKKKTKYKKKKQKKL